jgi:glycosyltransferase involved in cell wall biosynthesis
VFLEAARLLRTADAPRLRFYIAGGPIYKTKAQYSRDELLALAKELGVDNDLCFIPFQHNTAEVYRALDIVVHASTLPEPFGLTIAEAMACARPVIVSNAGGASELFTQGRDALGTPPGDPKMLADAILRLARDPELRATLGRNARISAEQNFNPRRLGGELLDLYQELTH